MDFPASNKEALNTGSKFYYTGISCKRGHIGTRYAGKGDCVACTVERANTRYKNKKEEVLAKLRVRYLENCDTIKSRVIKRRVDNPEKVRSEKKKEYTKHKDKYLERAKEWAKANPNKVKTSGKAFRSRNPDAYYQAVVRRRMLKAQRTPFWITEEDHEVMRGVYKECRAISQSTGVPHQVDHIVPLRGELVSGLHVPGNLKIITAKENRSKSNRYKVA